MHDLLAQEQARSAQWLWLFCEHGNGACLSSGTALAAEDVQRGSSSCSSSSSLSEHPRNTEDHIEEEWELCGDEGDDAWEFCDDGALSVASSEWVDLADLPEDDELLGAWLARPHGSGGSVHVRGAWAKKAEALPRGTSGRGAHPPASGTRVPPLLCKSRHQQTTWSTDEGSLLTGGVSHGQDGGEAWMSKSALPFRSQPRRKRKK